MSGKLETAKRDTLFTKFRNGAINLLIATNLAERGIDLPIVNTVINLEVPWSKSEENAALTVDPTIYLHRVGRTGRIGRQGVALTFVVSDNDRQALNKIRETYRPKLQVKTPEEVASELRRINEEDYSQSDFMA